MSLFGVFVESWVISKNMDDMRNYFTEKSMPAQVITQNSYIAEVSCTSYRQVH